MNPFISRLLVHIPSGYSPDPQLIPSFTINGTGSLSLTGETLYLTVGSNSYTFDLYNLSVSQLVAEINAVTPTTLFQDGIVELIDLMNGQTNLPLPATVCLPSNELYFLLGMEARILEGRLRSANTQVAQINLQAAQTRIINWWGASTGIPRYQGEPDVLYAQRITGMRFRPTQNNYSIQRLLKTLGYSASVTDTTPGQFIVRIQLPNSPPQGWTYSLAQIADIVNQVKSATYQASISVNAPLSDAIEISDSITSSTNPQAWTWGDFTWGQFTWNDEDTYYFVNPGMIIQD